MKDPQQFGREMAEMVRGYVARAVEPLRAENESLRAENKAMLDCLREVEARAIAAERHIEALAGQSEEIAALHRAVEAIEIPEAIPGPAGRDGKDGVGIAEVKQNDDGELIVKMTTGETFNVGKVRGEDGLGFDDMTVEHDGERGFAFIFAKGDRLEREEFSLPVVIDRGTWKEERTYQPGDGVTAGGSYWIAQTETSARPETSKDWRLAVKRGRDGKDGTFKMAPEGPVRLS